MKHILVQQSHKMTFTNPQLYSKLTVVVVFRIFVVSVFVLEVEMTEDLAKEGFVGMGGEVVEGLL